MPLEINSPCANTETDFVNCIITNAYWRYYTIMYVSKQVFFHTAITIDNVTLSISSTTPPNVGFSTNVLFTCTVQMTCSSGPCNMTTLSLTWFNNNNQISGSEYSIVRNNQVVNGTMAATGTLSILAAVTNSHAGAYLCRAQLDSSPSMDSPPVNLTVQRKLPNTGTYKAC